MSSKSSLDPHKYDVDSIPMRIEFIKSLLAGKELKPLVNFDETATEYYTGIDDDAESGDSHDTRIILRKRLLDFKKIILEIGGKLKYIKSGTTGHTFKGIVKKENDVEFEYAVKVVAYPKKERYGSINDTRRPENAELMMIKLLSYFVVNKQTPHLVIPFGTFNTSIDNFVNLVKTDKIDEKNDRYKEFIERYKGGEFSSTVSILISEWANRGDLLDFLRNHYKSLTPLHWKALIFQLISTLAIIQSKYPSFRHNDMKANNILIHKINVSKDYHKYTILRNKYRVPNIGYHIKLWDFDFACIPGIVDNIKVEAKWTKKINVTPEQNRYYDIHYFFNTLMRKGFFPQILTDPNIPQELKQFIDRIVPTKFRTDSTYIHEKGRILVNTEHMIPEQVLLTDPYFEEFRLKSGNTVKPKKKYDLNNLLQSEKNHIPKSLYSLKPIEEIKESNEPVKIKEIIEEKEKEEKKLKTNKVKKPTKVTNSNINILKMLGNKSESEKQENNNILDIINFNTKKKK